MTASNKMSFVVISVMVFGITFGKSYGMVLARINSTTDAGSEWTQWSEFGLCSVSCGLGSQSRTRACLKLAAKYIISSSCKGDASECQQCVLGPCPVNGGWSEWSDFGECPVSCGGSSQFRTRKCNNPEPFNGGSSCTGITLESRACNIQPCPVHGGWSDWSCYSICTKDCGNGVQHRNRSCTNPAPSYGGVYCAGNASVERQCNEHPCEVNGGWSEWSDFGECPVSCGGSSQFRTRKCNNPEPFNGGSNCTGITLESRACNIQPCPVHGGWSDWSRYSICTKDCGNGVQHRNRSCTNPAPSYGGVYCAGNASVERQCNEDPCKAESPMLPEQCTSNITLNLTESWRKDYNHSQGTLSNSDIGRLDGGRVWFRFSGMGGRMLKNTCPHAFSCGSTGAYWSNGTLPATVGQTLNITLYESFSTDLSSSCTFSSFSGSVTRCSEAGDFVYKIVSAMSGGPDTVCGM